MEDYGSGTLSPKVVCLKPLLFVRAVSKTLVVPNRVPGKWRNCQNRNFLIRKGG